MSRSPLKDSLKGDASVHRDMNHNSVDGRVGESDRDPRTAQIARHKDEVLSPPSDSGDQARSYYSSTPSFCGMSEFQGALENILLYPPPLPPSNGTLESLVGNQQGPVYDYSDASFFAGEVEDESDGIKAVVEEQGYISLHLRYDTQVDIAPNQAIRIVNHRKATTLALSGCATQMALVHPQGRVLQYNSRIEVQTQSFPSVKNAKMWPRGVSFTSNNCALVYLVDQAGVRSTTDSFHNLYSENIADSIFSKSCQLYTNSYCSTIEKSIRDLEKADYWRTDADLDCWMINNINIKQTPDGLVTVERKHGLELFTLKTSPSNGKARLQSSFLYLTASMGEESHIFVKSNDRRIHYNGQAFVVRNAGHSAGFDDKGQLRIW